MTPMPSRTFPKPLSESDRAEIQRMIQERQPPESAYAIWEEEKEARVNYADFMQVRGISP